MNSKKPTFLVIDDDTASLALVKASLSQLRYYDVDLFEDAHEAQKAYQTKNYDILILDIRMPHLSGIDILTELNNTQQTTTDVVVITAHAEREIKTKVLQLGAKKVFIKPYNVNNFLQEIKRLLDTRNNSLDSKI